MRLMKTATALMALTTLTACDRTGTAEFNHDRADRAYRTAMADYQAGRIPQAVEGLKKTCSANPANASARFQMACLLQDSVKDYLGAYSAFPEYLLQRPESEKAKLATARMATCEREMAKSLAEKYAPESVQDAMRTAQETRASAAKIEADRAKLREDLNAALQEQERLRRENTRLKELMRDEVGVEEPSAQHEKDISEARALVADEGEAADSSEDEISAAKDLINGDATDEPPPMLEQSADAKAKRAAARAAAQSVKKPDLYPHENRPETYVVQEGDTLYKIAVRFYGRASMWSRIRSANKAVISTDGRLRAGQKIVLPAGE